MVESIDNLLKSEKGSKQETVIPSKKLNETKRRISNICKFLTINSKIYSPQETVDSVEAYIKEIDKVDRILYSEISTFIIALDEEERGIFSTNIEKLILYALDEVNEISEDARIIIIKIYDHFQLNLTQIESANNITQRVIIETLEREKIGFQKEIKGIEKDYITILGIFAAIILTFVGGFTFSTSVLNNISKVNIYDLVLVSLIIGLVFISLIATLMEFLREINNKVIADKNEGNKTNLTSKLIIIALFIMILCFYLKLYT